MNIKKFEFFERNVSFWKLNWGKILLFLWNWYTILVQVGTWFEFKMFEESLTRSKIWRIAIKTLWNQFRLNQSMPRCDSWWLIIIYKELKAIGYIHHKVLFWFDLIKTWRNSCYPPMFFLLWLFPRGSRVFSNLF